MYMIEFEHKGFWIEAEASIYSDDDGKVLIDNDLEVDIWHQVNGIDELIDPITLQPEVYREIEDKACHKLAEYFISQTPDEEPNNDNC